MLIRLHILFVCLFVSLQTKLIAAMNSQFPLPAASLFLQKVVFAGTHNCSQCWLGGVYPFSIPHGLTFYLCPFFSPAAPGSPRPLVAGAHETTFVLSFNHRHARMLLVLGTHASTTPCDCFCLFVCLSHEPTCCPFL